MITEFIKDDTFHTYSWFVLDCSQKEFGEWVKKKLGYVLEEASCARGVCITVENNNCINFAVWVGDKDNIVTLAHEIIHLVAGWCREYSISFTEDTEEIYTLLHSFYFERILKVIDKKSLERKA